MEMEAKLPLDDHKRLHHETYDFGIERYYLDDGKIGVIATEGDMRRAAMDMWAEVCIDLLKTWPPGQPVYAILKLDGPKQGFTNYARQRSYNVIEAMPNDTPVYAALILKDSLVTRIMSGFLATVRRGKRRRERIFADFDEAYNWLKEMQRTAPLD